MLWPKLRASLAGHDGLEAKHILDALRDTDFGTWNGLYWRANKWFVDWFRARAVRDEKFPYDDFAEDDFVRFIIKLYPQRRTATWGPEDLPHMLHDLRAKAKELAAP
jgi:hypothetical protein